MNIENRQANEKRIRTAELGNRDKRDQPPPIDPKLAVSGSDSVAPPCQNPAKAREILGLVPGVRAKPPQPETEWRREWDSNPRYLSVHTLSKRAP